MQSLFVLTVFVLAWTVGTQAWDAFNLSTVPQIIDTLNSGSLSGFVQPSEDEGDE